MERKRWLTATFRFPVFGTEEQARQTTERVRNLLSVELGREVELVTLEMSDDVDGEPDEDASEAGLHAAGNRADGASDAAVGDEPGAAGRA